MHPINHFIAFKKGYSIKKIYKKLYSDLTSPNFNPTDYAIDVPLHVKGECYDTVLKVRVEHLQEEQDAKIFKVKLALNNKEKDTLRVDSLFYYFKNEPYKKEDYTIYLAGDGFRIIELFQVFLTSNPPFKTIYQ